MEYITHSTQESDELAYKIVDALGREQEDIIPGTATILALSGNLGAGKTAFVKGVAKVLGVPDMVTSPTFVIEKIYSLDNQPFSHLIHIDAYRLESGKELESLGWHETATDPRHLICIEWPEKVEEIIPERSFRLEFEVVDENTRRIQVDERLKIA